MLILPRLVSIFPDTDRAFLYRQTRAAYPHDSNLESWGYTARVFLSENARFVWECPEIWKPKRPKSGNLRCPRRLQCWDCARRVLQNSRGTLSRTTFFEVGRSFSRHGFRKPSSSDFDQLRRAASESAPRFVRFLTVYDF